MYQKNNKVYTVLSNGESFAVDVFKSFKDAFAHHLDTTGKSTRLPSSKYVQELFTKRMEKRNYEVTFSSEKLVKGALGLVSS